MNAPLARSIILSLGLLSLCVSGCAAFHPVNGIPARYLPDELRGGSRSGRRTIDLSLLRRAPQPAYLLDTNDVLGVYIEGMLGRKEEVPPVHFSPTNDFPPALGYPMPVREDGTLSLPVIGAVPVRGLTIIQAENAIRKAYTQDQAILQPHQRINISLQRPREHRVLVIRQETGIEASATSGANSLNLGVVKRGTGKVVTLPAYQNDVLHALAETGGLPGLDAENAIYVIRRRDRGGPGGTPYARPQLRGGVPGITGTAGQGKGVTVRGQSPDWDPAPRSQATFGNPAGPRGASTVPGSLSGESRRTPKIIETPKFENSGVRRVSAHQEPTPIPGDAGSSSLDASEPSPSLYTDGPVAAGPPVESAAPVEAAAPIVLPPSAWPSGVPALPGSAGPTEPAPAVSLPVPVERPAVSAGVPVWPYAPAAVPPVVPSAPAQVVAPVTPVPVGPAVVLPMPPLPAFEQALPDLSEPTVDNPNIIRIPIRLAPGDGVHFTEADIILEDGDIVFIESRDTEVFYTGGLLGGGQYTLPRDYDLDILGAIAVAQGLGRQQTNGRALGGASALNNDVTISASTAIVIRELPDDTQVTIRVNLYKALRDPAERIIIQPGDYILLQYTKLEACGAFIERHLLEGALFGVAAAQVNSSN